MIRITVEAQHNLTTFICSGTLKGSEILDTMQSFYEGSPTLHVLWDLSDTIMRETASKDVGQAISIIQQRKSNRQGGKTAIVAPRNHEYGMARMFQTRAKIRKLPFETKIFKTLEEARQWLLSVEI
ncbi:MAG: hypothetical protein JXQ30_13555 [Spirochaetes bacterium]|nr:hypothetical protein [Spirochaetota bacterium]